MSGQSEPSPQPGSSIEKVYSTYNTMITNFQTLDVFQTKNTIQPEHQQKQNNIESSKQAKGHFFSYDQRQKYKEAVEKDEELKIQQFEALDSIDYYNKRYIPKDKMDRLTKITGSFFKVRAQGGASSKDIEELNKFYKRALVTMFAVVGHSYMTVNWLYDARFITMKGSPKLFTSLPYAVYPVVLLGAVVYMFTENSRLMNQLDKKYTPLWLEISKKI